MYFKTFLFSLLFVYRSLAAPINEKTTTIYEDCTDEVLVIPSPTVSPHSTVQFYSNKTFSTFIAEKVEQIKESSAHKDSESIVLEITPSLGAPVPYVTTTATTTKKVVSVTTFTKPKDTATVFLDVVSVDIGISVEGVSSVSKRSTSTITSTTTSTITLPEKQTIEADSTATVFIDCDKTSSGISNTPEANSIITSETKGSFKQTNTPGVASAITSETKEASAEPTNTPQVTTSIVSIITSVDPEEEITIYSTIYSTITLVLPSETTLAQTNNAGHTQDNIEIVITGAVILASISLIFITAL